MFQWMSLIRSPFSYWTFLPSMFFFVGSQHYWSLRRSWTGVYKNCVFMRMVQPRKEDVVEKQEYTFCHWSLDSPQLLALHARINMFMCLLLDWKSSTSSKTIFLILSTKDDINDVSRLRSDVFRFEGTSSGVIIIINYDNDLSQLQNALDLPCSQTIRI